MSVQNNPLLRHQLSPSCRFSTEARGAKLSCLELHPLQPWALVLAVRVRSKDKEASAIQIWDYAQKLLLTEVCLEDVDWQFDLKPGAVSRSHSKDSSKGKHAHDVGAVRCLKFADAPARPVAERKDARGWDSGQPRQWIAVLGQHRTLLLDLDAMRGRDVTHIFATPSSSSKKGVPHCPSRCVVLSGPNPGLSLLGCAVEDTIQLVDTSTWRLWRGALEHKDPSSKGSSKAREVTQLVACPLAHQPAGTAGGATLLVSGSDDGLLLLWDPSRGEVIKASKAHEAGLTHISYNSWGAGQLVTAGKEGVVRTWAVPSLEQQWEVKLHDGVAHALHCRHPALAHDALWLYRPGRESEVWCMRGQAMEHRVNQVLRATKRSRRAAAAARADGAGSTDAGGLGLGEGLASAGGSGVATEESALLSGATCSLEVVSSDCVFVCCSFLK